MLPDAKRKMSEKGRHTSEMQELPGGSESDHRSGSYSEVAPTQIVETNFPIVSFLHHDSFSSATTSSDPGQFRKDALRCAQILLHQFRGLPPPTALSSSGNHVPPYENRFWSICSPKVLLRKIGVGVDSLLPGESLQHGGFTDSIVYDRDTASVPGLHLPLVLDMVRDGVKNRLLNVLGFASVFCSVILIFSSFIFVVQQAPIPRNIVVVKQPDSLSLSTNCPDTASGFALALLLRCLMRIELRVTSIDGKPIKNQAVIVSESFPTPLFTVNSPFSRVGQTHYRNDGSAESLRYDAVSSFVFTANGVPSSLFSQITSPSVPESFASRNSPVITDSDGLASIVIFALRSPPGLKKLSFFCGGSAGNTSVSLEIFIESSVVTMLPLSPTPSETVQAIGMPFSLQPSFKLCGSLPILGQCVPVPYQVVVAVSESMVTDGSLDGNKMAQLTGFVSAKSDLNGVVTFTDLAVVGSSSQRVYFSFYAGGQAWATWDGSPCYPATASLCRSYVELFGGPIVQSLTLSSAPFVVNEGVMFPQIAARALSAGNAPIHNIMIYAQFSRIAGSFAPKFTTPLRFGKKLLRSIAATNQTGHALFNLSTTVGGFAGTYDITFLPSFTSSLSASLPVFTVLIATSVATVTFEGPHTVVRTLLRSTSPEATLGYPIATTPEQMQSTDYATFFKLYFNDIQENASSPQYSVMAADAMSNFVPNKLVEMISEPAMVLDLFADTLRSFGTFQASLLPFTLPSTPSVLFLKFANPIPLVMWLRPPIQLHGINTARFYFVIDGIRSSAFVTVFLTPPVPPSPLSPSEVVDNIFALTRPFGLQGASNEFILTSFCNVTFGLTNGAAFNSSDCLPHNTYSIDLFGKAKYCIPNCPLSLSQLLPHWYQFEFPVFHFVLLPSPVDSMSRVVGQASVGATPFALKYGLTTFDGSPIPSSRLAGSNMYFRRYRTSPIPNSQSFNAVDRTSANIGLLSLLNNVYRTTGSPFTLISNETLWITENAAFLRCKKLSAVSPCYNFSSNNFPMAPASFVQNFSYTSGISGAVFADVGLEIVMMRVVQSSLTNSSFQMQEPLLEVFEFGPPSSLPGQPRNPLANWILFPPRTFTLNSVGFTLKFERSQMLLEVSNRVADVVFVSATANADGGIDIVASARDASGAPVPGRSLSCWVRSLCGLANDMAPGVGPGTLGLESPMSELSLPSYCPGAGYPQYVFDIYQGSNISYLNNQLFLHYTPYPQLSQLLSEDTLASVLISSHSSHVAPIDTLSNKLISPLFYGLQSSSISDLQGRAVLHGVRLRANLPGAWTLQCGVDGIMMSTPVKLVDEFLSQPRRPSKLRVVNFPLGCLSPLNNSLNPLPCKWPLYSRRDPGSVASSEVLVTDENGYPLPNISVHMVIVPMGPFIPFPYSSTAHLPTHYAHRLISKLDMTLYARSQGGQYPSSPPGESEWPAYVQAYGSAVSLPSNATGIAVFDNIGLFDLADGAIFQVVFAFAPGVPGAVWSNKTIVPIDGSPLHPFYRVSNIISRCVIIKQPTGSIPDLSDYSSSPFVVQVGNRPDLPYRYVIASVRIIVRQSGVILGGASAVVDPFSGLASLEKFKLIRSVGLSSVTYDIVSNGVVCTRAAARRAPLPFEGNSIKISAVPAVALVDPVYLSSGPIRHVTVGLQSISIDYSIFDANDAELVGIDVRIKVLNSSIMLQGPSGPGSILFAVSSPPYGAMQFIVASAVTGSYQFVLVAGNAISLPFSVLVTNPVQGISIIRQPMGSVDTAQALTVQPRLSIASSAHLEGQRVYATVDPSCTPGVSVLFDTCVVLPDSTCEFQGLAVVGINREGAQKVCFGFSLFGVTSTVSQPVYVSNPSVPKFSELNGWETIIWTMVLIIMPINAMNNSHSGPIIWLIGFGFFCYFLIYYIPRFFQHYSSVPSPPAEYTVVFVANISMLLFFSLVFIYEVWCASRRRVVALMHSESKALQLQPAWFSLYRLKCWNEVACSRITKRSQTRIAMRDRSLSPEIESSNSTSDAINKYSGLNPVIPRKNMTQRMNVFVSKCNRICGWLLRHKERKSLLHDSLERTCYFNFPQRLWIAFSVTVVGIVSFFAVYMYFTTMFCEALISYRMQISNVLSRIKSFVGAASVYLELITSKIGYIEGLRGSASEAATNDEGLSSVISAFLQQEPTAAGFQVAGQFSRLTKQMQEVINEFPVVISAVSSLESGNFNRVLRLIQSSAIGAIVILALLVPILWFQIFQNWRKQIMGMRVGRYSFDRTRIDPPAACNFIGFQLWGFIGTCAFTIAFFLHPLFFILGLVGTFPFIFTEYIWPVVKDVLLGLIAVKLLSGVFEVFLSPFLCRDGHIIHSRLFSIYDYAYSNISIISGIFGLAVTIFIKIMSSFISLSSLHFDSMPTSIVWFSQMLNPALWSYRAALMVDHDNTNPIKAIYLEWFSNQLQLIRKAEELACSSEQTSFGDDCSGERKSKSIRQERIRNRFHLWVLMSQNPSLIKYRKKTIQAASEYDHELHTP